MQTKKVKAKTPTPKKPDPRDSANWVSESTIQTVVSALESINPLTDV